MSSLTIYGAVIDENFMKKRYIRYRNVNPFDLVEHNASYRSSEL